MYELMVKIWAKYVYEGYKPCASDVCSQEHVNKPFFIMVTYGQCRRSLLDGIMIGIGTIILSDYRFQFDL